MTTIMKSHGTTATLTNTPEGIPGERTYYRNLSDTPENTTVGRLYYRRSRIVNPQWMRTLEEKYKRLHMKIRKSTSSMTYMYNSNLGRNIGDPKVFRVNKGQSEAVTKTSNIQGNRNLIATVTKVSNVERNKHQALVLKESATQNCKNKDGNTSKDKVNPEQGFSFNVCNNVKTQQITSTEICVEGELINENKNEKFSESSCSSERNFDDESLDSNGNFDTKHVRSPSALEYECEKDLLDKVDNMTGSKDNDKNMNNKFHKKPGLKSKQKRVNIAPEEQSLSKDKLQENSPAHLLNVETQEEFITHIGNRISIPRTKTSVSRRSNVTQKTSKSCPAAMEKPPSAANVPKTIPSLRAKSAYVKNEKNGNTTMRSSKSTSKVFSRMSIEAQQVMNETFRERDFIGSPISDCKRETQLWIETNFNAHTELRRPQISNAFIKHDTENKLHHRRLDEDIYETNFEMDDIIPDDSCSDSEISIETRKRPITSNTSRTRLPNIPKESQDYYTLGQLRHLNFRLPGIGMYEIATLREKTFEITPPGYDIRYNDIAIFEEGERESPPEDIRDKAVQKCQEWLSRYTPRKELSQ